MTRTYLISLGRFSTSMNLEISFLDEDGNVVDTATPTELGNGRYMATVDVPIERGAVVVTDLDRDTVLQVDTVQTLGLPKIRRTKPGILPNTTSKENPGYKYFPALSTKIKNVFYDS